MTADVKCPCPQCATDTPWEDARTVALRKFIADVVDALPPCTLSVGASVVDDESGRHVSLNMNIVFAKPARTP